GIVVVAAVVTALNPLVGLAATAALSPPAAIQAMRRNWAPAILSAACAAGAMLAMPAYYQMVFRVSGGSGIALRNALGVPIVAINFCVPVALAILGARRAGAAMVTTIASAGCVLLLLLAVVHLPEGNEHNLGNAAQCLLAVAAGVWVAEKASQA